MAHEPHVSAPHTAAARQHDGHVHRRAEPGASGTMRTANCEPRPVCRQAGAHTGLRMRTAQGTCGWMGDGPGWAGGALKLRQRTPGAREFRSHVSPRHTAEAKWQATLGNSFAVHAAEHHKPCWVQVPVVSRGGLPARVAMHTS